jgi:hypothetical protein
MARGAASKHVNASDKSYPQKYWWLVLIVVPIAIALMQFRPWRDQSSGSGGGTAITFRDLSIVTNEAAQSGAVLSDEVISQLKAVVEQSQAGRHAAAVAGLEKVRASSAEVAALPSLLVSLADEYRRSGKEEEARQTYKAVLKKDPANQRVLDGLGSLPDAPLDGLTLVNFTGQRENIWGDAMASNLVDGNPSSLWVSRDGQFPQTFIFALPGNAAISEVSFNNQAYGDANRGARDVEISVSSQSATSGFAVAATAALAPNDIGQGVRLKPGMVGRWIKVRILSNHGNKEATSLGDIMVSGKPRT